MTKKGWDIFISHASEDKDSIARPLAEELQKHGMKVWYDDFTLTIGDSLRSSIDRGLADSKYGVVILNPFFFNKKWTKLELDGLVAKTNESEKVILPVFHKVDQKSVAKFSPVLADKLAVSTSDGLDTVVQEILRVACPSAFSKNTNKKLPSKNHSYEHAAKKNRWQSLLIVSILLLVTSGFIAYAVITKKTWGQEYNNLEQIIGKSKIDIDKVWNAKKGEKSSAVVHKNAINENLIERKYWIKNNVIADELVMREGNRNKRVVKRTYYYPDSGDLLAVERVDSKMEESRCAPRCIVTDFYLRKNNKYPFIRKITTEKGVKITLQIDDNLDGTLNITEKAYLGLFPYTYLFYVF